MSANAKTTVGLALGSGSARGWSHIGVLRALKELEIEVEVVCGTSIGALVGGFYTSGNLHKLEQWLLKLDLREIIRYLDVGLLEGGGFIEGKRLIDFFRDEHIGDVEIKQLRQRFAAVATNLASGEEVWLQQGSLLEAIRASIALPGFFTPVQRDGQWLVDGGLVNPVPVSLCRELGANSVIAVNLNSDITGKHLRKNVRQTARFKVESPLLNQWLSELRKRSNGKLDKLLERENTPHPGLFDVLAGSINIMQDRITRERLADHPADILLEPKLSHLGLLEFDRADEAIEIGYECAMETLNNPQTLQLFHE